MISPEKILGMAESLSDRVVEWRRDIHKYPELSYGEHRTAAYICDILSKEGIPHRIVAQTGVIAFIEGKGDLKQAVVLRADTDALPLTEKSHCPWSSRNPGVMHACGHDMHTAALLGALAILNGMREEIEGTVIGLFQPGEEVCPGGATLVLADNPFGQYDIRAFVGQHIDPALPTGVFGVRQGKYMASGDEIRITVRGKGGHAALRNELADPVTAAAAVITALQEITSRNSPPLIPTVLSIGKLIADGATNIVPDEVYMEGTLRTLDEQWRAQAKTRIREVAQATCQARGTEAIVDITDGYPVVLNDPALTRRVESRLCSLAGNGNIRQLDMRLTAEDFGYYTHLYPSVFYRFGAGGKSGSEGTLVIGTGQGESQRAFDGTEYRHAGKLHTSSFDPDEKSLQWAVAGLVSLALDLSAAGD